MLQHSKSHKGPERTGLVLAA